MTSTEQIEQQQLDNAFADLVRAASEHDKAGQAFARATHERNASIRAAREAGLRVAEIVGVTGVTQQRVHQILKEGEA